MTSTSGYAIIKAHRLRGLLAEKSSVVVLDPLQPETHLQKRLPGAVNACVFDVRFPLDVQAVIPDKSTAVVVYGIDDTSREARVAGEKLIRLGYENVSVFEGGMAAWEDAGFELEGEKPYESLPVEGLVLSEGDYRIDLSESRIDWAGRNPNIRHRGSVRLSGGSFSIRNDQVSGRFIIDMASITNDNLAAPEPRNTLLRHLGSDDFFLTSMFPEAAFVIDSVHHLPQAHHGGPNLRVHGTFELRGIRAGLELDCTAGNLEDRRLSFESHFDLDRTHWGIVYGSGKYFKQLGKHFVFDAISIDLRLVTRSPH